jgi:hypothetical protein
MIGYSSNRANIFMSHRILRVHKQILNFCRESFCFCILFYAKTFLWAQKTWPELTAGQADAAGSETSSAQGVRDRCLAGGEVGRPLPAGAAAEYRSSTLRLGRGEAGPTAALER